MTYRTLLALLAAAAASVASLSLLAAQVSPPNAPLNLRVFKNLPPPPDGPQHAYFATLQQLPQHHRSWSLRSQQQINSVSGSSPKVNTHFTYDPQNDDYHTPQDGVRYRKAAGRGASVPTGEQLWLPIAMKNTGSVLITWDWWWGKEWRTHKHPKFNGYKMWQVQLGQDKGWWTIYAIWRGFSGNATAIGTASNTIRLNGGNAPGNTKRDPFTPTGQGGATPLTYPLYPEMWTRYWVEVKYFQPPEAFTEWSQAVLGGEPLGPNPRDPQGRWHMISQWFMDEKRGLQRLIYRAPVMPDANLSWPTYVGRFRFEMNSSQSFQYTHDMTAYGRNVVVLFDYELPQVPENDTFLFQRPK